MRTLKQKQKPTQETMFAKPNTLSRAQFGQNHDVAPTPHLQPTIRGQAVQQQLEENTGYVKGTSTTTEKPRFGHDFSQIPVHSKEPVTNQAKQESIILDEQRASLPAFNFGKIMAHTPSRYGNSFTSLTTGNNDEGIFRTAIDDVGAAPSNSFDTQVSEFEESTIAPLHPCVPTVRTSRLPSGHIAARVGGGRFSAPFNMTADFETPIPCNGVCGEYRQFVSGYSQVNGQDIVHPLCGNNMSRSTEYEDCLSAGGRTLKYGYHSIPFATSRFTNPDQATGWSYRGFDAPGFNLASFSSGTVLNWNLKFRGELVDACNGDKSIQSSSTWTAGGSYTVP